MRIDILAFAAHPDDVELAASGTLMKHKSLGKTIGIVDLTQGELGSRGTAKIRQEEADAATKIMQLDYRTNLQMADGFFEISKENKLAIIREIRKCQPKVVLINAQKDRHPDHGRASELVSEACYYAGLRKIETKENGKLQEMHRPQTVCHYIQDWHLQPDFIVDVSAFVAKKLEAIQAYKTQFYNSNSSEPKTPISGKDFMQFVQARMREFGRPIGAEFGEGFIVERPVGVEDVTKLG